MNRFRLLAITSVLTVAAAVFAQQPSTATSGQHEHGATATSKVEAHLQALSEKLDLTSDQQEKIRPILQRLFDGQQKLMQDTSLSDEQRHEQMKALHEKADKDARQFLNDDQKKKLGELESEHHHSN